MSRGNSRPRCHVWHGIESPGKQACVTTSLCLSDQGLCKAPDVSGVSHNEEGTSR